MTLSSILYLNETIYEGGSRVHFVVPTNWISIWRRVVWVTLTRRRLVLLLRLLLDQSWVLQQCFLSWDVISCQQIHGQQKVSSILYHKLTELVLSFPLLLVKLAFNHVDLVHFSLQTFSLAWRATTVNSVILFRKTHLLYYYVDTLTFLEWERWFLLVWILITRHATLQIDLNFVNVHIVCFQVGWLQRKLSLGHLLGFNVLRYLLD